MSSVSLGKILVKSHFEEIRILQVMNPSPVAKSPKLSLPLPRFDFHSLALSCSDLVKPGIPAKTSHQKCNIKWK